MPGFSSAGIDTTSHGLVFIGANDRKLHAVNAATGANVWTYDAASATMAFNSVAVADGRVHIIDYDTVKALDRNRGNMIWSRAMPAIPRHSPAVAGSLVVVHDNSNVHGLNGFTGAPAWQRPIPGNGTANARGRGATTTMYRARRYRDALIPGLQKEGSWAAVASST